MLELYKVKHHFIVIHYVQLFFTNKDQRPIPTTNRMKNQYQTPVAQNLAVLSLDAIFTHIMITFCKR